MSDFYCDEVLSGKTAVQKVRESERVLAYFHTRPFYPVHIVVIPKLHIPSLVDFEPADDALLLELMAVIREVALGRGAPFPRGCAQPGWYCLER